jgi:hypothetical protein
MLTIVIASLVTFVVVMITLQLVTECVVVTGCWPSTLHQLLLPMLCHCELRYAIISVCCGFSLDSF